MTIKQHINNGFILPATVMLGLAVSIMAALTMQYVVSSSETLNAQSYNGIAQEAAYSGLSYGLSCIASASTGWSSLTPNSSCAGAVDPSKSSVLVQSPGGEWKAAFTVNPYNALSGQKITAVGTVTLASGVTINATRSVTITTTLAQVPVPDATDKNVTDISTDSHSCAIANGQLYCWGINNKGQIGDGTTNNRNTPTLVSAFAGKMVTKVAVGTSNTCAVADGQLYCWGDNTYKQLGMGPSGDSLTNATTPQVVANPTAPAGMSDFKVTSLSLSQSATGSKSACAIANGIPFCWGANDKGQLGRYTSGAWGAWTPDTSQSNRPTPIWGYRSGDSSTYAPLYGKKNTSTSIGRIMGCSLAQGIPYCWGDPGIAWWSGHSEVRTLGASGDYPSAPLAAPWSAQVVGNGMCTMNDIPICYATGTFGLFSGQTTNVTPLENGNFTTRGVSQFDSDDYTSESDGMMCVMWVGFAVCHGKGAYTGVGGVFAGWRTPFAATGVNKRVASKVGVGEKYGCVVTNGALACWGDNAYGQLAAGTTGNITECSSSSYCIEPIIVGYPTVGVNQDTAGSYWRFSAPGPLGVGNKYRCSTANGVLFCWGDNTKGQLGTGGASGQNQPTKADVSGLPLTTSIDNINVSVTPPERITSGSDHSCMISLNNVYCWGDNTYGQLGINNTTAQKKPVAVSETWSSDQKYTATEVSAGPRNTCAIVNSQLYCWGDRSYGMVGDNGATTGTQQTPVKVPFFTSSMQVTAVSVGTNHVCAIANGDGYCWGDNTNCETGRTPCSTASSFYTLNASSKITSGTASTTFGNLTSGTFTQISAGNNFSCAIINGAASCWGRGKQTGTNTASDVTQPTSLSGAAGSMQADVISAGDSHACAVLQGSVYCWGDNTGGKLGNNSETESLIPIKITGGDMANGGGRATVNVVAGVDGTCSISNGAILCWGAGLDGQIGDNGLENRLVPTVISGYRVAGACEDYSCKGALY